MVDQEFFNEYIKLNSIYNNERLGNIFKQLVIKIFITGVLVVFTLNILDSEYNVSISDASRYSFLMGWFLLLFFLVHIGAKIRDCVPIQLSNEDKIFIKTVELLGCIDRYKKEYKYEIKEGLRNDASIIILEIVKMIYGSEEKLYILKQNIREILLPNIMQGSEEDMDKSYVSIEKLAKYFLNPTHSYLVDLNNSIMELKHIEYVKKKGILNLGNILAIIIISIPLILYYEYGFIEIKDIIFMILGTIIAELILYYIFRIKNKG